MFHRIIVTVAVTLVAVINPVLSQDAPPCPPTIPGLAAVVDTPEKCMCFYSLAGSGFEAGDSSTFDTVLNDDSVQNFAQTGKYFGLDGIAEYLSWVKGGALVRDFIPLGEPLFLDMTGTTMEQCVATIAVKRRMPYNPFCTKDNQEVCVELVAGSVLYYTMTGNPVAPITIQKINAWLPDDFISVAFPITDTKATAEFVCDAIVNTCGYDGSKRRLKGESKSLKAQKKDKSVKASKNTKAQKKDKSTKASKNNNDSNAMEECMETYKSLPNFDDIGGLSYIDGNTKACRYFHAVFANTNSDHCPHISFDAEEDVNGIVKCNMSKQTPLTALFTDTQLELFSFAATKFGFGSTGIDISFEACPTAP